MCGRRSEGAWAAVMLRVMSIFFLLYAMMFILLGGAEDVGMVYSYVVAGIFVFCLSFRLIAFRKKHAPEPRAPANNSRLWTSERVSALATAAESSVRRHPDIALSISQSLVRLSVRE